MSTPADSLIAQRPEASGFGTNRSTTMETNALDTLAERGFVHSASDADGLRRALDDPITFYVGFDPTASSLTAGHFVQLVMAAHLQRAGHRAVFVAGGGTALVGDPSERESTRAVLSEAEIARNVAAITSQLSRLIEMGEGRGEVIDNSEWLRGLDYLDFLREIGRHFRVNEMIATDTYRRRLESGASLNFVEFNYRLLQAYDFLHLYRTHGCVLQVGGSDQWSNILAGVDLIRRVEDAQAFGLVSPLLVSSTGEKMGKTAAGALWLDADQTSPYEFYQYWINVEDQLTERLLSLMTFLPMAEVEELSRLHGRDAPRAKERLAHEVTALVHGVAAADEARESSRAVFADAGGSTSAVPETTVAVAALEAGLPVFDLLVSTGLAASRGEARRLIRQGGAYLNDLRIDREDAHVSASDLQDGSLLLRAGRKRYHRVRVEAAP